MYTHFLNTMLATAKNSAHNRLDNKNRTSIESVLNGVDFSKVTSSNVTNTSFVLKFDNAGFMIQGGQVDLSSTGSVTFAEAFKTGTTPVMVTSIVRDGTQGATVMVGVELAAAPSNTAALFTATSVTDGGTVDSDTDLGTVFWLAVGQTA